MSKFLTQPEIPIRPVPRTVIPGVQFNITITAITGSGLSRTISAKITNSGASDAHNAWIKLKAFSQGARIALSGADFIRVDIGAVPGGTSVTKQADLQIGLADGLKVAQNGARFVLTITSDEATQTYNYDYK